ncbi:hypothetical protein V6N12_024378 [Hibiscus sabdariffa]|uniref:Uncharacterized protein n=1 Tax=Hibiscus sabdariffa TaxID=183260 RepID=A0ABR2G0W7_9ROSI
MLFEDDDLLGPASIVVSVECIRRGDSRCGLDKLAGGGEGSRAVGWINMVSSKSDVDEDARSLGCEMGVIGERTRKPGIGQAQGL